MLMPGEDVTINAGRIYLTGTTGRTPILMPHPLPEGKLDDFCQGIADVLLASVGQENARAAELRSQPRRLSM
jgi:hypothetical protein